jgi:hypothetical protein
MVGAAARRFTERGISLATLRAGRRRPQVSGPSARTKAHLRAGLDGENGARTGVPPGIPGGAMCVQRFDDSLNSAIHITYRISLRSSSLPEPRDPLLKVLFNLTCSQTSIFETVLADSGRRGASANRGVPRQAPNPGRGCRGWGWRREAFTQ